MGFYSGFQLTLAARVWKYLGNLGTTLQNSRLHCYAPINVKPEGGGGVWHRVGILTFSKKIIKIPTPGRKRIVKMSRKKWFTSLLLYKVERSNA